MEITERLKSRFCKDCNIPITLFMEPYFTQRLKLYDQFYGTLEKWERFVNGLRPYACEQDYFEEYNHVKDLAMQTIQNTEAYKKFNAEDMNKYRVKHENLPSTAIFKATNDGRTFISVDMKKANFSSLHHYSAEIFPVRDGVASSWEEFIGQFTDNKHIINSKYIRQVVLGNCNPKRHITYEKYLMDEILTSLEEHVDVLDKIVFFSNDEIVLDITELSKTERGELEAEISLWLKYSPVPVKVELFTLHKIHDTDGYYKEFSDGVGTNLGIELKCLPTYMIPFVLRKFAKEEVTNGDMVFLYEGLPATFLEIPQITFKENELQKEIER